MGRSRAGAGPEPEKEPETGRSRAGAGDGPEPGRSRAGAGEPETKKSYSGGMPKGMPLRPAKARDHLTLPAGMPSGECWANNLAKCRMGLQKVQGLLAGTSESSGATKGELVWSSFKA